MTTQNNNEFLEGESDRKTNFENEYLYPGEFSNGMLTFREFVKAKKIEFTNSFNGTNPIDEELRELYKEQLKEREND